MKKCPFCAEEIQEEAIKCRYCGEYLDPETRELMKQGVTGSSSAVPQKAPWFFSKGSLIMSFLVTGPFMLPLVWFNPKLSRNAKIIWTVVVVLITLFIVKTSVMMLQYMKTMYDDVLRGYPTQ